VGSRKHRRMTQNDGAGPSTPSSSRTRGYSNGIRSPESFKRLRSGSRSLPSHQTDPIIDSLDEHEEVEIWLNEVVNTRRDQASSALQLRVETKNGSSSPATWTDLASLEAQLSALSSTLSFARQDTMSAIDSTINNVKTTIPRLGLELRLMKDAAMTLKTNIDELRNRSLQGTDQVNGTNAVISSDNNTASAALERLSALSTLHSRMTSARDVLSLAESWSTLSADVSSYLNDAKFSQASTRLAEAKTSLTVFERTPEYESRKILLEGLCDSLVSNIKPSLEISVKEKNVSESQRIAGILSVIGRADDFADQWRSIRMAPWLMQWRNARLSDDNFASEASGTSLPQVLQILLDSFLTMLNEERLFAPALFPQDPRKSMSLFTSATLLAMDPPLETRLKQSIRQDDQAAILVVVRTHSVIKDAVAAINKIIARVEGPSDHSGAVSPANMTNGLSPSISPVSETKQLGHPALSPITPNATRPRQTSHARNMSTHRLNATQTTPKARTGSVSDVFDEAPTRQSASDLLLSLLPEPTEWESALLGPLVELQLGYADLERRCVFAEREKETLAVEAAVGISVHESAPSTMLGPQLSRLLREDLRIAKSLAEDATTRNLSLTFGLASDDLVSCLDDIFVAGLTRFKGTLESRSRQVAELSRKRASGKIEGTIEVHSSSVEDDQWKSFEESVGLLTTLHQCELIIEEVELFIAERLKDVAEMVLNVSSSAENDALLRVCGQGTSNGICKAPLAILIRHHIAHLSSGSFIDTLQGILAIEKDRKLGESGRRRGLLLQARLSLFQQLKTVQQHLADMTLAPLISNMELYTSLPIWEALRLPGSVNEYDLAMPTFSLSPTEEMSRIGEGLLDLPRLLEVWSDNADLRWAVRGLPHVSANTPDKNGTPVDQVDVSASASLSPQSSKRTSFMSASPTSDRRPTHHRHSASLAAIATIPANSTTSSSPNNEDDSDSVLQTYLSSIALSLLSHIVSLVLPSIPKLTAAGCSQLVADLEYLLNILSALNVNSTAISATNDHQQQAVYLIRTLEAWKDSCKLKDADGKRITSYIRSGQLARGVALTGIAGFEDDEERLTSLAGTPAFMSVARMRGW
jgi:hypothetical protein